MNFDAEAHNKTLDEMYEELNSHIQLKYLLEDKEESTFNKVRLKTVCLRISVEMEKSIYSSTNIEALKEVRKLIDTIIKLEEFHESQS